MKSGRRAPGTTCRKQPIFPDEFRIPSYEQAVKEEGHPLPGRKGKTWPRPIKEEGDFREYYRIR